MANDDIKELVMFSHFAHVWLRRRLPNWKRLTAPTAVISLPINGFSATVGVPVTLDPTNTTDPDDAWVGTWTITGPGAVVRFTHTGTFNDFASHVTSWTPAVAEGVTVTWVVTDGSGQTDSAQVMGNVVPAGVPKIVLTTQPSASAQSGVNFGTVPVFQLRDANNNNLAVAGVSIVVTASAGTLAMSPQPIVTDANGQASPSSIKITGAVGNYSITGGATGYTPATSNTIALTPGPVSAAQSTATVPNGTPGVNRTVTVQARDSAGNARTTGGDTVNVSVTGANPQSGNATDNGNGTYTKTLTSTNNGTDTVTITLGGVGISGSPFTSEVSASNEPGGTSVICETNFSTLAPVGAGWTSVGMISGMQQRGGGNATVISDASAPHSPSNVMQIFWRSGIRSGFGPGADCDFWSSNNAAASDVTTSYTRFYFKVGGPDFQNQGVGTKICYWSYANTNRNNHSWLMLHGDGKDGNTAPNGTRQTSWTIDWYTTQMNGTTGADPGSSGSPQGPNVNGSKRIVAGQWHLIELLWVKNTGLNQDGIGKLWIDGVLTHSILRRWCSPINNLGNYRIHKHEIWGGDPTAPQFRSDEDYFYWDHLYVSGIV